MNQCPYVNVLDPEIYTGGAPHSLFRALRHEEPVHWHEDPSLSDGGLWVLSTREHIDEVSKNPGLFSSWERSCVLHDHDPTVDINIQRTQLINMDPPDHIKYRRIVRNAFTPKTVDSYRPRFEEIAKEVVDNICADGTCEFVGQVAAELPLIAICEIMGIPIADRQNFFTWTNTMLSGDDPDSNVTPEDVNSAAMQIYMYANSLLEKHRNDPQDNLLSRLVDGVVEGEHLTTDEFNSFFLLLLVAGIETTRTVTTQGMRLLIEHPEQLQYLQDNPDKIPDFVEETLRYNTAVNYFVRTATKDVVVGGKSIKQGQRLLMLYQSANHDEAYFSEPEIFDVTRPQREDVRQNHRSFGIGQHFCIGSHLARLELTTIFSALIPRIENPRLTGEMDWLKSNFINAVKKMPMAFDLR